jgi:hypothetical protein
MQLRVSDLWRWDGTLDRGSYVLWGCLLFALKYNMDRLVAGIGFEEKWSLFSYLELSTSGSLPAQAKMNFYATLLALALPFIYVGVVQTMRRLRGAGLPRASVVLFFVPVVNLFFFLVLSVLPDAAPGVGAIADPADRRKRYFDALIPQGQLGSAALALLVTTAASVPLTVFAIFQLHDYGFGVFVGLPFVMGLVAVLIYGYHGPRTFGSCLSVACLTMCLLGLGLLASAVEGVICILMAAPIGLALAALGGAVGYYIQAGHGKVAPQISALMLLFLPILMGAESVERGLPPLIAVTSSVEIDAPPERVWPNVIAFGELPTPTDWVFKTGISYPMRAKISGAGVGAIRRCEFSTGPFVEPITAWEPPYHLAFDVTSQPRSMNELSPYGHIKAPHIDHFLLSEHGEFRLVALPHGRTRLEGTTWYRHRIWPAIYWRVWSDAILHRIHLRVLDHVKTLSESQVR